MTPREFLDECRARKIKVTRTATSVVLQPKPRVTEELLAYLTDNANGVAAYLVLEELDEQDRIKSEKELADIADHARRQFEADKLRMRLDQIECWDRATLERAIAKGKVTADEVKHWHAEQEARIRRVLIKAGLRAIYGPNTIVRFHG